VIKLLPIEGHPMDAVRTAVSFLGMLPEFAGVETPESAVRKGISLMAKIPTVIAAIRRQKLGEPLIAPATNLTLSENFFQMCFGEVPEAEVVEAFDGALTLYAEHGFNASTFTARVIVSTQSDLCSAVTGAIGALKGNLHGGANEAVMHMLLEIDSPEKAQAWIDDALINKSKVMGFGHRLYRLGDSRVPTMSGYRSRMAKLRGGERWEVISAVLEETMVGRKNIFPNLDFPAGPVYYLMGFEIPLFTPIFVIARVVGWTAHVAEQLSDNRLVRPSGDYIGAAPRAVVPLDERG
jgi:2-methylcitrate synthase